MKKTNKNYDLWNTTTTVTCFKNAQKRTVRAKSSSGRVNGCKPSENATETLAEYIETMFNILDVSPKYITLMKNPPNFLVVHAIKKKPEVIKLLQKQPTEKTIIEILKTTPEVFKLLKNPSDKCLIELLKNDIKNSKYIVKLNNSQINLISKTFQNPDDNYNFMRNLDVNKIINLGNLGTFMETKLLTHKSIDNLYHMKTEVQQEAFYIIIKQTHFLSMNPSYFEIKHKGLLKYIIHNLKGGNIDKLIQFKNTVFNNFHTLIEIFNENNNVFLEIPELNNIKDIDAIHFQILFMNPNNLKYLPKTCDNIITAYNSAVSNEIKKEFNYMTGIPFFTRIFIFAKMLLNDLWLLQNYLKYTSKGLTIRTNKNFN